MKKIYPLSLLLLIALLAACNPGGATDPTDPPAVPEQPDEATDTPTTAEDAGSEDPSENITPTICPQATPEWLRVWPVTSPTSELTQVIYIDINNGESVTVTSPAGEVEARQESGTLEDPNFRYNFVAEVDLVPDSENQITVMTQIKQIERDGCPYGGYPLTTNNDINFEPLIILQESE